MSGNIITASNLVVAGNIAVGGFLVQGTTLSQGNVNFGSITISGVQLEVITVDGGVGLNLSGSNLVSLNICSHPIGGGGGWVGTAATDLNMSTCNIHNVTSICGVANILNIQGNTNFNKQGQAASIFIHPDTTGSWINIGTANGNITRAGVGLTVSGNAVFTGGILDLSGYQLEVSGTTINFSGASLTELTICGDSIVTSHPQFSTLSATVGGYSTSFTTQHLTISGVPFVADLSTLYIGVGAGVGNTDSDVIAIGTNAAQNNNGHPVIAIGNAAAGDNSGNFVYAVGDFAAAGNQGEFVNAVGYQAGSNNTGYYVDAIGTSVATNNSGTNVVAIGQEACANNTGSYVIAFGYHAAQYNTCDQVIGIGTSAVVGNTGSNVIGIGIGAGSSNAGNSSIFIGTQPWDGFSNTTNNAFEVYSTSTDPSISFLYGNSATNQVAIGTRTLSGALNVSGTICVNNYAQPFIQYGEGTLAAGTVTITPTVPYGNSFYSIAIAPKEDNSGFYVDGILSNQFSVIAANSTGSESWQFRWTTFGSIEQPPIA